MNDIWKNILVLPAYSVWTSALLNVLRNHILLFLLLLAATILRMWNISFNSLYPDELGSIAQARTLADCLSVDTHPPLYFILLHMWGKIFGTGDAALRMLSVLFGTATVAASYFLFKTWIGEKFALLVGASVAFSSFHIFYSQEIRAYTLLSFLTLSVLLFFSHFEKSGNRTALVFYVLTAVAICYVNNLGFVVPLSANLLFAIYYKKHMENGRVRPWLIAQILLCFLAVPWLVTAFRQWKWTKQHNWFSLVDPDSILSWLYEFIGFELGYALIAMLFLAVIGVIRGLATHRTRRSTLYLFLVLRNRTKRSEKG